MIKENKLRGLHLHQCESNIDSEKAKVLKCNSFGYFQDTLFCSKGMHLRSKTSRKVILTIEVMICHSAKYLMIIFYNESVFPNPNVPTISMYKHNWTSPTNCEKSS